MPNLLLVVAVVFFASLANAHAQSAAATPVLSRASGQSVVQFTLTATSATTGATLRYTADGTEPVAASPILGGNGLSVTASVTVKVKAFAGGYSPSATATGIYQVTGTVTAGRFHSVALRTDGTVWTWGLNTNGELGLGNSTPQLFPTKITNFDGVAAVASGTSHTLALKSDGSVWAWGQNGSGQLGDNTTTRRTTPTRITALNNVTVTAIACGDVHSMALDSTGGVWVWGSNGNGQVGDNTTTQSKVPKKVTALSSTNIKAIAAGGYHCLALQSDGKVWAWGLNGNGQLGDNTTTAQQLVPVAVSGLGSGSGATTLRAGLYHSVALKSDGTVWTWGNGVWGVLGNGVRTDTKVPGQVPGISGVLSVQSGGSHILAQKSDGTLWAWGNSIYGQVGNDTAEGHCVSPVQITTMSTATLTYGTGMNHSLMIAQDGTLWGCGDNSAGQLGGSSSTNRVNPVQALALGPVKAVSGGNHTLAVRSTDGTVWACGLNGYGQLGDGTLLQQELPVQVPGLASVKTVAAGTYHSLALSSGNSVWAWGYNAYGQLGDGTKASRITPIQVPNLGQTTAIAAGASHSLALTNDGFVRAWGLNSNGQLGDGTVSQRLTPVTVSGLNNVIAVAAGQTHNLALRNDRTVWAWGANESGQLGDNSLIQHNVPFQIAGLSNVLAISAGASHSMALTAEGEVWVWGSNNKGQLGDNNTSTTRLVPWRVTGLGNTAAISAGDYHSVALNHDGTVWNWGFNNNGQLGDGTVNWRYVPVQVPGVSGVIDMAAASAYTLVRKEDGSAQAWGNDLYAQLGVGIDYAVPQLLNGFNMFPGARIPVATVTSPANNASALVGQPLTLQATASEIGGAVSKVQYFNDDTFLGEALSSPYSVTWTPGTWGNFAITAFAIDTSGTASAPSTSKIVQVQYDGGSNGLPDWWEMLYFHHVGVDLNADPDLDGLTNVQEYQQGSDPTKYYTGAQPSLQIMGGNDQYGTRGTNLTVPLVVRVTKADSGVPYPNAPVIFEVTAGAMQLRTDWIGDVTQSCVVHADADGYATIYCFIPYGSYYDLFSSFESKPGTATPRVFTEYAISQRVESAGVLHSLVVDKFGAVWSWGRNNYGQLGHDGNGYIFFPLGRVPSLNNGVTAVAAGDVHSLALKNDGTVWAWGGNGNGQLGNNTYTHSLVPVQVLAQEADGTRVALRNVVAIVAGGYYSLP